MNEIEQLKQRITELENQFRNHSHTGNDSQSIGIPENIRKAPLASVTSPSGGATIDAQARNAVSSVISRLRDLGLIL